MCHFIYLGWIIAVLMAKGLDACMDRRKTSKELKLNSEMELCWMDTKTTTTSKTTTSNTIKTKKSDLLKNDSKKTLIGTDYMTHWQKFQMTHQWLINDSKTMTYSNSGVKYIIKGSRNLVGSLVLHWHCTTFRKG